MTLDENEIQKDMINIFCEILESINRINSNLQDVVIEIRELKEEIKTGVIIFN